MRNSRSTSSGSGIGGERRDQGVGHPVGHGLDLVGRRGVAEGPVEAGPRCVLLPGGVQPHDAPVVVHDLQPAADVHRRRGLHPAAVEDRELRRPAADVDVEDAQPAVVGELRGPRPVGGEHRLHVVPGGRRHQFAAALGEHPGDGLGVAPAQGLPGQDHDAGVDLLRAHGGLAVGAVDDRAEFLGVDVLAARVRGQRHRRAVDRVPPDDDVAAGQLLADAAQVQPGEDDLRARRADVHPDAVQRDVVLLPDRVVLERHDRVVVVLVVVVGHVGGVDDDVGVVVHSAVLVVVRVRVAVRHLRRRRPRPASAGATRAPARRRSPSSAPCRAWPARRGRSRARTTTRRRSRSGRRRRAG